LVVTWAFGCATIGGRSFFSAERSKRLERRRIVVVGQGYVGLPVAMRAVEVGYQVTGYDVNESRIKRLLSGDSYVEDVGSERLRDALDSGRYHPSAEARDCAGFDVALVTVPTPLREGNPDLSFIEQAAETLARYLRPGATFILESTTYPGTTRELVAPILEQGSGLNAGTDFCLGYSPERIDPGNAEWKFDNTPKVVAGIDPASLEVIDSFYRTMVERTIRVSGLEEAELTKLVENTFRHVNIALVNELAMFAADLGINMRESLEAASTKPYGFMRFDPGPGVGGHCLPIDPSYLSWRVRRRLGHSFRFVELATDVNNHMPDYVVRRIVVSLNRLRLPVNGSRILLLGLTYKRNTGDAREAPSRAISSRLLDLGADVQASDPYLAEHSLDGRVHLVEPTPGELAAADLVVLLTAHDAFDYDEVSAHARWIFDTCNRLSGDNVEHL
jgi:UDP-N-acetyl-D-glucosamine dehydrogenase